VFVFILAGRN